MYTTNTMADLCSNETIPREDELEKLTKEELITKLRTLQSKEQIKVTRCKKKGREINWEKACKRHVLLKFMYFGWDYHGFTTQLFTEETIEDYLFVALKQCCLIKDRESSNYHRCGRTDRGVSAFSQVISIDLRSNQKTPDDFNAMDEMPYCKMLNRLLPLNIRCYAWCPVNSEVSARFDCTERSYNYYFPRGTLNISAMSEAGKSLVGTHDFRNLCKMDVYNGVTMFSRTIYEVEITHALPSTPQEEETGFQMMKLRISSKGFLHHQIRCIMGVLIMVGEEKEPSSIISELLDVEKNPCKPQYQMASPLPLSLATANYENLQLKWITDINEMSVLAGQLQGLFTEFQVKAIMVRDALQILETLSSNAKPWKSQGSLIKGVVSKTHTPLLKRPTCLSLDDRIKNCEKRKARSMCDSNEECKQQKLE